MAEKLTLFISPQKWHMSFANVNHSLLLSAREAFSAYFQENWDREGKQAQTGGCDGASVLLPLTWSRRAFLNPHGFCQIDTNCPSKELRFILKSVKIHLLKLLG